MLFQKSTLKTEQVKIADAEFTFYELSAQARIEFFDKQKDVKTAEELTDVELAKQDLEYSSLLIAYSLKPGREETLEELQAEIKQQTKDIINEMFEPANQLAGFAAPQEEEPEEKKS